MDWKLSKLKHWRIWKLKLIDARLYFVSLIVGLLTGLVAVPYHYLLQLFFNLRRNFFDSHPHWYIHIPLFLALWGILIGIAWMVKKMPLITGGGIPQTRGVINGRVTYKHPFIELIAKFTGGVLALSAGLSLGREGPSVQIGSYVGALVSKWTHILKGEQKQLLSAGAGAGLAAAFAAPLSSSLLVIESIERFDAPKTAITTLLAGIVAGGIASMTFTTNPYHLINATAPVLSVASQIKLYLVFAVIVSIFGKIYSEIIVYFKNLYPAIKQPMYIKLLFLMIMAYGLSLTVVDLTGGGEQFLMMEAMGGSRDIAWVSTMMLLHFVFTIFSFASGLPGGSFIPTLVTGGLFGKVFALILIQKGIIGPENISYIMLISMAAVLIAIVRTPLTAIVLITEITGHFDVFYPSVVVGSLTYYFTELLQIKPFNVTLYEEMIEKPPFKDQQRATLTVEIMNGSYFDGKQTDELPLPEHCKFTNIHRDRKDFPPAGQTLLPGDQVTIELDSQDIEKLYEPLVSMANIY
ncbi:ClC family H(+)/Cl(-) exchange transporter [Parabacteroides pacaensis]|uniref:ClC family H(+)/Cl(-) exchange transporter n=1 Tax=Parabacteroides pacaensis TaxID=2086575 RepID=UPI000D0EF24E|nr:ClC family H(+)/Cl(-) exchange transporter [Parabacteroides pacaensis]